MSAKPPKTPETTQLIKVVNNLLLDRAALINRLREREAININEECGYPDQLRNEDYINLIERNGLAKRCNALYPDECWTVDPEVYVTYDVEEETAGEKKWKDLEERLALWHYFHRADEVSGMCSWGLLYIAFNDGRKLDQPVPGSDGPRRGRPPLAPSQLDVNFLRVFDETRCKIVETDDDERSPRHGLPTMYQINFADPLKIIDPGASNVISTQEWTRVHWSRIIHLADGRVSSELWGTPRLKNLYNHLADYRKVLGGAAEMFWKGAFPGIALETPDGLPDDIDLEVDKIKVEMQAYYKKLKRYIAFRNLKVKSLAPQVADPTGHIMAILQTIAACLGCPMRVLIGTEEGRLASSQDSRTWNKKVRRRQTTYLTPMLIRPFIERLVAVGVLPDEKYIIEWPDLDSPTKGDQADIFVKICNALFKYTASSAGKFVIGPKALLSMVGGFTPAQIKIAMSTLNSEMTGPTPVAQNAAQGARGKTRPSTQSRDPTMQAAAKA